MTINTSIIIVNWNGYDHLATCLSSVFKQTYKNFEVIFIDNGSTDDSVEYVKQNFPQVRIMVSKKNHGFADGNNIGIGQALKNPEIQYIATLNNDTEVDQDWLKQLITVVEQDERIGAVSSKILFFNQRNIIDSTGDFLLSGGLKVVARGYKQEDKGQFDKIEECFSARAGAALYRGQMLEEVCLNGEYFDSHYFAYIEDVDLSIRARFLGWKIMYAPKAIVYHKVAATTKEISYIFRRYRAGRNRLFTAIKNLPLALWPVALRQTTSVDVDYKLTFLQNLIIYLKIIGSTIVSLPRLLRQRRQIQQSKKISNKEIYQWLKQLAIE